MMFRNGRLTLTRVDIGKIFDVLAADAAPAIGEGVTLATTAAPPNPADTFLAAAIKLAAGVEVTLKAPRLKAVA